MGTIILLEIRSDLLLDTHWSLKLEKSLKLVSEELCLTSMEDGLLDLEINRATSILMVHIYHILFSPLDKWFCFLQSCTVKDPNSDFVFNLEPLASEKKYIAMGIGKSYMVMFLFFSKHNTSCPLSSSPLFFAAS